MDFPDPMPQGVGGQTVRVRCMQRSYESFHVNEEQAQAQAQAQPQPAEPLPAPPEEEDEPPAKRKKPREVTCLSAAKIRELRELVRMASDEREVLIEGEAPDPEDPEAPCVPSFRGEGPFTVHDVNRLADARSKGCGLCDFVADDNGVSRLRSFIIRSIMEKDFLKVIQAVHRMWREEIDLDPELGYEKPPLTVIDIYFHLQDPHDKHMAIIGARDIRIFGEMRDMLQASGAYTTKVEDSGAEVVNAHEVNAKRADTLIRCINETHKLHERVVRATGHKPQGSASTSIQARKRPRNPSQVGNRFDASKQVVGSVFQTPGLIGGSSSGGFY